MHKLPNQNWLISEPLFSPQSITKWDSLSVKDPTIVFFQNNWHMVYTARGMNDRDEEVYSLGYVSAPRLELLNSSPRHHLGNLHLNGISVAAPHLFYFQPRKKWYLIAQANSGSQYTPVYSTTTDIFDPESWTDVELLVEKQEKDKWIDFWVICNEETAYLIYTRNHRKMYFMTTPIDRFPLGFSNPTPFSGKIKVHEACMVYKIRDRREYVLLTETRHPRKLREFYISHARELSGPWTRSKLFASLKNSRFIDPTNRWTQLISHGEFVRDGYDQNMVIPSLDRVDFLIQGTAKYTDVRYASIPWQLGLIRNYSDQN